MNVSLLLPPLADSLPVVWTEIEELIFCTIQLKIEL